MCTHSLRCWQCDPQDTAHGHASNSQLHSTVHLLSPGCGAYVTETTWPAWQANGGSMLALLVVPVAAACLWCLPEGVAGQRPWRARQLSWAQQASWTHQTSLRLLGPLPADEAAACVTAAGRQRLQHWYVWYVPLRAPPRLQGWQDDCLVWCRRQ